MVAPGRKLWLTIVDYGMELMYVTDLTIKIYLKSLAKCCCMEFRQL